MCIWPEVTALMGSLGPAGRLSVRGGDANLPRWKTEPFANRAMSSRETSERYSCPADPRTARTPRFIHARVTWHLLCVPHEGGGAGHLGVWSPHGVRHRSENYRL